ncbi:rod shape-determining protein MreC [Gammaproteobacteria bacterium]|nr:rod shape-determining protein MreC [Gammaproteobacteria bacterium]
MNNDLHFKDNNITVFKLLLYFSISVSFLILDKNLEFSDKVRYKTSYIIEPIYLAASFPSNLYNSSINYLNSKKSLIKENKNLKNRVFIQSGIIQKIPALQEENERLKKLLGSSDSRDSSKILIATLIKVNLNPFSNKVIINKGKNESLYLGQTVIDSTGILGQISEINYDFSIVTLISDAGHALLGVNVRTGKRIFISGTGDNRKLKAKYISLNEDIREGDILITSGLDNVFPEGHLIGEISKILREDTSNFLDITVIPSSSMSLNKEVMLLW